jgi:hypothetical protein
MTTAVGAPNRLVMDSEARRLYGLLAARRGEWHRDRWPLLRQEGEGAWFARAGRPTWTVGESVLRYPDNRYWHHVSTAHRSHLPTWDELQQVRVDFVGDDAESYMVFPPVNRYVNAHRYALHLWRCLNATDGAVLPDFRIMGTI